jgi:hypothetical protein
MGYQDVSGGKTMKLFKNNIFKRKSVETNPKHTEFVEKTFKLLYDSGITGEPKIKDCSRKMMYSTKRFTQHIQSYAARGMDIEPLFIPHVCEQNTILEEYGIEDPEKRDNLIVKYFSLVKAMGEK